ncbi:hypothetical protein [Curtobacterium sp. MCBD17_023]|uniref:hypothetical protein n=1 Tax=Curtobacterium sp. MCBD17_023 TaxID=2175657 RepID=UPI000D811115|nr:hypothetical protein [Curtobacterium sp. MCBD17_023]PYY50329.1 hypothetical protein DEI84_06740 [Curtobacterium sp. MCBD17_023]
MSVRTRAMDRAAVRRRRDEAEAYYEVAVLCAASSSHADWKAAGANAVLGGIRSQTNRLVVALERLVVTMRQKTDPTS